MSVFGWWCESNNIDKVKDIIDVIIIMNIEDFFIKIFSYLTMYYLLHCSNKILMERIERKL